MPLIQLSTLIQACPTKKRYPCSTSTIINTTRRAAHAWTQGCARRGLTQGCAAHQQARRWYTQHYNNTIITAYHPLQFHNVTSTLTSIIIHFPSPSHHSICRLLQQMLSDIDATYHSPTSDKWWARTTGPSLLSREPLEQCVRMPLATVSL